MTNLARDFEKVVKEDVSLFFRLFFAPFTGIVQVVKRELHHTDEIAPVKTGN